MERTPNASYSFTMRVRMEHRPGLFSTLASAVDHKSGQVMAVDIARTSGEALWRDVTVNAIDSTHAQQIVDEVAAVDGLRVEAVSDRTFLMHIGGKLSVASRVPLKTRDDLSMAYTPGVARVCEAIAGDREKSWALTIKRNTVAVVSDGSAVLGLGNIGPEAAMPVMEGKALLFRQFAEVDAWPVCLDVHGVDEIVDAVKAIAPGFGGINLEDIASPQCFEIERRLREELDIPVFHDDQHGTAVVVLAALINALRVLDRSIEDVRVVIGGVGAAGIAVTDILLGAGCSDIVGCDRAGAIWDGRTENMNAEKQRFAERTNPDRRRGSLADVLDGADVFIGLSGPGTVTPKDVARMNDEAVVFAMANPTPEIMPEVVPDNVRIMATGRSDYPNQINNVLCFPGLFRGALDVRASDITEPMKIAAATAIAEVIPAEQLEPDYIVPSVFNTAVSRAVASAVAHAAAESGVARKPAAETVVLTIPR